ncbi:MAG: hypothetical protein IT356_07105 [Gemmatimonadaceae bacterium]|nr:hypothetical protein [Gemmatimonadaceae bacterium]
MTNIQAGRTLQSVRTSMPGPEVLAAVVDFFSRQSGIYAAFPEQIGTNHVTLRGMGIEEVAVGVAAVDGATEVSASSYMFDGQVAMFLASLPPAEEK